MWLSTKGVRLTLLLRRRIRECFGPAGCRHIGKGRALAINVTNIGRAGPVFAVLVLSAIGPLGLGATATLVARILFAIPPVLTNADVGMRELDRDTV